MEIYVILYWVGLAACAFALFFGAVLFARLFHRIFSPIWFVFPVLLAPPLIRLIDRPEFDSYLWRGLAVLCIAIVVWSFVLGGLALWAKVRARRSLSGRTLVFGRELTDDSQENFHAEPHELSWEEALQIVLALEERRLAFGFKPGWLYYQCRELPILLEAFDYLRDQGLLRAHTRSSRQHTSADYDASEQSASTKSRSSGTQRPAHEVLGVSPDASAEQIKAGYREQLKRYHPDRLQNFGAEFAALATEKTKEIQLAYSTLIKRAASSSN